ncbi:MAG TPA: sulfate adenylyltransferase subunit CysD [Chitinophagales bacterium]|nr:sulfate adenylyltransferase subunit CysD [Chitinophagales bacterium]
MHYYKLNHLKELEAESVYVIREVAAQFANPALLFSGGKDSIVMTHLARKAFYPARIPFPLVHIDTGHNFPETLAFRDELIAKLGVKLIVGHVQDSINKGTAREETGLSASRIRLQTTTLLETIEQYGFDAALGGARRDEEKARAKERFFSHRDEFGQWDPKNQRPELWNLFNGRKNEGEHFRVFPLSNWTELDVWQYIWREKIDVPNLYFSHKRLCVERNGVLLAHSAYLPPIQGEIPREKTVRFRTIGDMTSTGAIESPASTMEDIVREIATAKITERGGRADDKRSDTSMEDRKREGYF